MVRKIIHIDEDKCTGCGLCANACHEGAIEMVDGKAKLIRDDYCDGFGDCLPSCPTGAITFEEREALPYDEEAVKAKMGKKEEQAEACNHSHGHSGCPGSQARMLKQAESNGTQALATAPRAVSQLMQWPTQIKLMPVKAPYFDGAKLLIAADCTAFAYANMHEDFIKGHITINGCPKLDEGDYAEKLTEIISNNEIKEVTIIRMEVPCCGGLENAAKRALQNSGKFIPWRVVTVSIDGKILD
ncbi:MAG: 4Fe-4S binding protein [Veillonella sp.]|nr:4Fe-4S binding protein [Veillonella sp.]